MTRYGHSKEPLICGTTSEPWHVLSFLPLQLIKGEEDDDENQKVNVQTVQCTMVAEIILRLSDLKKKKKLDGYFSRDRQCEPWIQIPF